MMPAWSPSEPFANQKFLPDNLGLGGTIGFGSMYGNPYATNQNYQGTDYPLPNWAWDTLSGGAMNTDPGKTVLGTYQQTGLTLAGNQTVNALGLQQVRQVYRQYMGERDQQNRVTCATRSSLFRQASQKQETCLTTCSAIYYTCEYVTSKTVLLSRENTVALMLE